MNDLIVAERIAWWEKLKALVLDSVSSTITKRVYNMALNEFLAWFRQAPRRGFTHMLNLGDLQRILNGGVGPGAGGRVATGTM